MNQNPTPCASRVAVKIGTFNDWLYMRLKKNQEFLDSIKTDEMIEEFTDSLMMFLKLK